MFQHMHACTVCDVRQRRTSVPRSNPKRNHQELEPFKGLKTVQALQGLLDAYAICLFCHPA
eukprot:33269-Eustigmatos_ZCMA.PRE.1